MFLDPGTLLSLLGGILQTAAYAKQQFSNVEQMSAEEKAMANAYKTAVSSLQAEVGNVEVMLRNIINHGDQTALTILMNSADGRSTYDRLRISIQETDKLMKDQGQAVDRLVQKLKNASRFQQALAVLNQEDAREFKNVLQDAKDRLEERREAIKGQFLALEKFYNLNNERQDLQAQKPLPMTPEVIFDTAMDAMEALFSHNPFRQVYYDPKVEKAVDKVQVLNSSRQYSEKHHSATVKWGEQWVDEQTTKDPSVLELRRVQLSLMEEFTEGITDNFQDSQRISLPELDTELVETQAAIDRILAKASNQKFSIAFCGMVKAGKSLFLNALMGKMILPSDELPSTACPCRLRHQNGQETPYLEVKVEPFVKGLNALRRKQYGHLMQNYKPAPVQDIFAGILDGSNQEVQEHDDHEERNKEIHKSWVDLHPITRNNLVRFEEEDFDLRDRAEGNKAVTELLGELNDIARLCHRFKIPFSMTSEQWPVVVIEFDSLRKETINGVFEFIDLPGIGEVFEDYNFEDLIREVAQEVNTVVPIVSFKEIPKGDWRRLPQIIKPGMGRAPEVVLCTHFDQISQDNVQEQKDTVKKVFWSDSANQTDRILPCSSRMGLSAYTLLRRSEHKKPPFKEIWDTKRIEYDCAEKILGVGDPEDSYRRIPDASWKKAVERQLRLSELPGAIERLTLDIVKNAQQRISLLEGEQIRRLLRKPVSIQRRLLLDMRRTQEDFETAYNEFMRSKEVFLTALKNWSLDETRMHMDSSKKLHISFERLETGGMNAATTAVNNVAKKALDSVPSEEGTLVFENVSDTERFLFQAQRELSLQLTDLKRLFVELVRQLANRAREDQFRSLKNIIEEVPESNVQPELKEEILEELEERGLNVETLVFSSIKQHVLKVVMARHNPKSAFQAIERKIAAPILQQKARARDIFDDFEKEAKEQKAKTMSELGFMVRAPIAAIATIPFVLGAGVWPFMARSKKYYMNKDAIVEQLQQRVVRPFLDSLQHEGENTLTEVTTRSSTLARTAVEDALKKEADRYELEKSLKAAPPTKSQVAAALSVLTNLCATEAALLVLQKGFKEHVANS